MKSLPPESIYGSNYWTHENGRSTLKEQVYNVNEHKENGLTKNEFVLRSIEVQCRKDALELGCAPGILLKHLKEISGFDEVFGIEADPTTENDLRELGERTANLHFGYFPYVTKEWKDKRFDLIIGLDIFEHAHKPFEFLAECARLLKVNGQLLLMGPFREIGEMLEDRFFTPTEHVYIWPRLELTKMLCEVGLTEVKWSKWTGGHDLLSARRR